MKTIIAMLVTLSVIGIVSGGGLAMVSSWADPLIAKNKQAETERAIFLVQPQGKSYEAVADAKIVIYRVFDENKQPIGYSLPWVGNGFQGKVVIMIGLKTDLKSLTSIEILEQVETPGLGTKIMEDPFRKQFDALPVDPQVDWVKGAPATKPNEIQTITGATISSKAVVAIVNDGLVKARTALGGSSK